jgi:TetR/AcrR family transcriptional regulator, ethionamide resistance regulator
MAPDDQLVPPGDGRELAILATLDRLLDNRPLTEISVNDLAKGAGLSRPTFYFYFASKEAALSALLERVIAEMCSALNELADNPLVDPKTLWRMGIAVFIETSRAHPAVRLVANAGGPNKVRELWSNFMQKWADHVAAAIEDERACGAAPATSSAVELAAALCRLSESVWSDDPSSRSADRSLDTLSHIWNCAIYVDSKHHRTRQIDSNHRDA